MPRFVCFCGLTVLYWFDSVCWFAFVGGGITLRNLVWFYLIVLGIHSLSRLPVVLSLFGL